MILEKCNSYFLYDIFVKTNNMFDLRWWAYRSFNTEIWKFFHHPCPTLVYLTFKSTIFQSRHLVSENLLMVHWLSINLASIKNAATSGCCYYFKLAKFSDNKNFDFDLMGALNVYHIICSIRRLDQIFESH